MNEVKLDVFLKFLNKFLRGKQGYIAMNSILRYSRHRKSITTFIFFLLRHFICFYYAHTIGAAAIAMALRFCPNLGSMAVAAYGSPLSKTLLVLS